ncbi:MAG TPA: flagellar motor switch protein FliN [Terracidiphilus sp.]|nr:flagellar motor switch protein FliN [Terracidiphilus sp.]
MNFLDCWQSAAAALFSQALAGEPDLTESAATGLPERTFGFSARIGGDIEGRFSITLDASLLDSPLMGEVADQKGAWAELLQEVTHAASGDLLAKSGVHCRVEEFEETSGSNQISRAFVLRAQRAAWSIFVDDGLRGPAKGEPAGGESKPLKVSEAEAGTGADTCLNVDLFLDVELEATLRFGRRELRLAEILEMGPGDVVELDRQVSDPVDLIVGDKIVARGQAVLVNGNFGLRVTEVATPRKRLETVRCLF